MRCRAANLPLIGKRLPWKIFVIMSLFFSPVAISAWIHVACHGQYAFSASDNNMSCSRSSVLEDGHGYFVPIFSKADANRETGTLSVSSGGGSIRNVGFNGGMSKAYLRKTFELKGHWFGWLPVTVNFELAYLFNGFGESQLSANLWTYRSDELVSENQMGVVLRYDGFEHTNLVHSRAEGNLTIPAEGSYDGFEKMTFSATHFVHHSMPTVDVRIDLLGWSSPSLSNLGSRISGSIEADASVDVVAPRNIVVFSTLFEQDL